MELLRLGVAVGGKNSFAVVDKVLCGAVVDKDPQARQRILEGHVKYFADSHVEALVESCAVDGTGPGSRVIVEAQAAGSVRSGVEVEIEIPVSRGLDEYLAGRGNGAVCRCFAGAEGFDAADRRLEKFPVFDAELTGQAHASFPVLFFGGIVIVGESDPADENGLVGVSHIGSALCRIEVKAVIQVAVAGLRCERQGVIVHFADQIDVVVCALGTAGKLRILRRENKDVTAADIDDIGAFPHASKVLETDDMKLAGK